MVYTILGLQNTYCFFDDVMIVSTKSESDQIAYVIKFRKKNKSYNSRPTRWNDGRLS